MGKIIIGTGSYLPERVVTNEDIERASADFDPARAGSSLDEWCRARLGAVERRRVQPGEGSSDMGTKAAQRALDDSGLGAADLDLIVLSTITSDYPVPPSAALVQSELCATARFIQVDAACTGFVDALMIADALMDRMEARTSLVVGTDAMSHYLDPEKFRAQTIFGDGAGAVILQANGDPRFGVKAYSTGSCGKDGFMVHVPAGGTKRPITAEVLERREQYMELALKVIPSYGVAKMVQATREVAERAGVSLDEIDWIVPHQASSNIVQDCAEELRIPIEKFVINFDRVGNTSAGSIPVALDEARRARRFKDGDRLILPAVGAGMAWSAAYVVWHDYAAGRDGRNGDGSS